MTCNVAADTVVLDNNAGSRLMTNTVVNSVGEHVVERSAHGGEERAHLAHNLLHIILLAIEHKSLKIYVIRTKDISIVKGEYVNVGEIVICILTDSNAVRENSGTLGVEVGNLVCDNCKGRTAKHYGKGKCGYRGNHVPCKEIGCSGKYKTRAKGNAKDECDMLGRYHGSLGILEEIGNK